MSVTNFFYEPFYSLAEFDRLFDDAFRSRVSNGSQALSNVPRANNHILKPWMDVHESKETDTLIATFELPGLKREDVQIDLHNDHLIVSGESSLATDKDENGWTVRERRFGKFSRTLPIPQGAKAEDIKANMENGLLTVTFPKVAPKLTPQKITVA